MQTTQDNLQTIRALADFFEGDASKIDVIAEDFTTYGPGLPPEGLRGREAYQQYLAAFDAGFPGRSYSIDTLVADGETVMTEWTVKGEHQGEFNGIPATGKAFTLRTAAVYVVKDGQVHEERVYANMADLFDQLGLSQ